MFFTELCKPRISDFGRNGKISLTALVCMMEDVAAHHSTFSNDDVLANLQKGAAWVTTNWRFRLTKLPQGDGNLSIATWAYGLTTGATVSRGYTICAEDGEELLRAEAKFVRLDIPSGKPVRITGELYKAYMPEESKVFDEEMKRLVPPKDWDFERPFHPRKSDIDFNGHVHNTHYLDIAEDVLAEEGIHLKDIYEIHIAYRKPIRETDTVSVTGAKIRDGYFLCLRNEEGPCSYIEYDLNS